MYPSLLDGRCPVCPLLGRQTLGTALLDSRLSGHCPVLGLGQDIFRDPSGLGIIYTWKETHVGGIPVLLERNGSGCSRTPSSVQACTLACEGFHRARTVPQHICVKTSVSGTRGPSLCLCQSLRLLCRSSQGGSSTCSLAALELMGNQLASTFHPPRTWKPPRSSQAAPRDRWKQECRQGHCQILGLPWPLSGSLRL